MSLNFINEYKNKLVSFEKAVSVIKNGDWIDYGLGVNSANELDKALSLRKEELHDINIRSSLALWPHYTVESDLEGKHFHWNSWHFTGKDREYYEKGLLSYIPMRFRECPVMTREDCIPNRVFMGTVGPMDKHGYFNFGASAASAMAAIETAQIIILEVNANMPRVLGGGQECVHISRIDFVVEGSNPELPELPFREPGHIEKQIASNVIDYIHDGSCLQLGIGDVPNAIGLMVADSDLKDLGVHSEMYADAFLKMTEAGKITGARKAIDKYKQTFTLAYGSRELYEFIDDNSGLAVYPVDYINSYENISQLDNFISINGSLEVDLFGQVCAETIGTKHISGSGGQLDFVEGAYSAPGGKSFICMNSTYNSKNGPVSRIRPTLSPGAVVTDPRSATQLIATEYGVVNMKGKSTWERAEALVSIAHPDFRDELVREAEVMKIWRMSNR